MIKADITAALNSLQTYQKTVERKLKYMVVQFSYLISSEAIKNTPLGDSVRFEPWYLQRQLNTGLQPIEGFARGSWQASTTGQFRQQEYYGLGSGSSALSLVKGDLGNYRLGQTVYIGNNAYYIQALENNYSSQTQGLGIMKPTSEAVFRTYQVDMKRLFDEG